MQSKKIFFIKMNKNPFILMSLLSVPMISFAQEELMEDESEVLDEIIISTQIEPQSLKKTVHNVRIISSEDIQNQAANHLGDVLNQYLKINVMPNTGQGRSTVALFGLDSQYLKILVDNVPMVSDSGVGNAIDLTQINLNDVERIEIVEGSMGVTHGANAVSGIINIVTKRKISTNWQINTSIIEETVGKEYAWFDKGKHIQNLKISRNFSDKWFVSFGGSRNHFLGYLADNHSGIDIEENKERGFEWLPKKITTINALASYTTEKSKWFYKADYFTERIQFHNSIVKQQDNYPFDPILLADDRNYLTHRMYHHVNTNGKLLGNADYNLSISYQKQTRDFEDYQYFFSEKQKQNFDRNTYEQTEILYSTGQLSNFIPSEKYALQVGYELVNQQSFASGKSGLFRNDNNQLIDVNARFENYDVYSVLEYKPTEKWTVRPGARYSFQSRFDNQYSISLGTRYGMNAFTEFRLGLGKSYRTPNFTEMYTYFIDSNHHLEGNKNLTPEQSLSVELNVKHQWNDDFYKPFRSQITSSYISVKDRISMALVGVNPTWQFKYINIDNYNMWNTTLENSLIFSRGEVHAGLSLLGISQQLSMGQVATETDYLFTYQANAKFVYKEPLTQTQWAVYFKHQGKQPQYVLNTDENNQPVYKQAETAPFTWLDASITKKYLNDKLWFTVGARNLLNIKSIRTQLPANIGHSGDGNAMAMGYGTSFFVKAEYQLNF